MNGGLLVNNGLYISNGVGGIQSGVTNVNYGGLAKGAGYYDSINVTDGGRYAPGNSITNSTIGSLTLNSGSVYQIEINRANGTAGGRGVLPPSGWDLLNLNNLLQVNAAGSSPATIELVSRNAADTGGGSLPDFDRTQPYAWLMFHVNAGGTIVGFDSAALSVDTTLFANLTDPTGVGAFRTLLVGNAVFLTYTPVPEPAALLALAGLALAVVRWRRA